MGQNVNESIASFIISVDNGLPAPAFSFLDRVLEVNQVVQFSTRLERIIEWEGSFSQYQLKIRDIIAEYLGFESIYFALHQPSYAIFRLVAGASNRTEARSLLSDTVLDMVQEPGSQIDQSCIEIDDLMETPYIVLTPHVLSERVNELESCKISYFVFSSGGQEKYRYNISDLLKTHYGRKMANAFKFNSEYPIIGKNDFLKLKEILQSFGHDVESNLVEIPLESWPYIVTRKIRAVEQEFMWSTELWLLYKTYLAMMKLGSDDEEIQKNALREIEISKSKNCNAALATLVANGNSPLQIKAIEMLETSWDSSKIDYLCNLIPETEGAVRKRLAKAVSTMESAQYFMSQKSPPPQTRGTVVPATQTPEVTAEYMATLDQLSRASSADARIDAAKAISTISVVGVEAHLRRLMNDDDPRVRLAVLEASDNLPKDQAVGLIRQGIQDTDSTVENKALQLFEERWPDSYW